MESIIDQVVGLLLARKPNGDNMFTRAEVAAEAIRLQKEELDAADTPKGAPCGRPHCLLEATRAHLSDMRRLVFEPNVVEIRERGDK